MDELPNCPKCGYGSPWGIDVQGQYDGVLYWECPSCQHMWPRFREGTPLHAWGLRAIGQRVR